MKKFLFPFVVALCLAGCTAQTRIEPVHLPVPPAEGAAAETPTGGEEAYPNAKPISIPTRTIRETVELGQEDTEPEPLSCPVCGG